MKKEKNRRTAEKTRAAAAPAPSTFEWWHYALAIVLSAFTALAVYGPALRGEFLFDDSYLPFLDPRIADAPLLSRAWLGVRPLLMTSYWLNYHSAGLNPYPYHVVSVLLHALNAVLAWLIVRRYLRMVDPAGRLNEMLAVFAGLLFLLHPAQTESVAYVASRSEALSVFFFLAALAVYLYGRGKPIGWLRAFAVFVVFGIACTVKEHTVVLPALLALTDYYFTTPFSIEGIRRNWRLYLPVVLIGAAGIIGVIKVLQSAETAGFRVKEFTWYQYLFTQFRSIWLYIRLYVFPVNQNGDYDMAVSRSIVDHGAIFGLIGLLILAALAWRYRREYPLASFGFFGFLLLLAPTSSIVPIRDVAVERRLYLPFICLLLITVDLLRKSNLSKAVLAGVIGVVSLTAAVLTYERSQVWSSSLAFWTDVTSKSPNNARAWFQLAYAQWQAQQCVEAAGTYERVAKLQPLDEKLAVDWAHALDCANRPDEAVAKLNEAAKTTPNGHIYATIGMIHGKRRQYDEAIAALATAEKLDPAFEMTYVYRGNVMLGRGEVSSAINEYKRALAINPGNQTARDALAIAGQTR
jgi:tetratricopeptide (TPR) repeat protein